MMRIINIILFLILTIPVLGQKEITEEDLKKKNYQEVIKKKKKPQDRFVMYPNGMRGVNDFVNKNFRMPMGYDFQGKGTVVVMFVVDKTGKIRNIEIKKSFHPAIDKELVRVVELLDDWIPAFQRGKYVNAKIHYPLSFNFEVAKKKDKKSKKWNSYGLIF